MGSNIKKVYIKLFMETIQYRRDDKCKQGHISQNIFFAGSCPIFILKILRASTLGGKNIFSSEPE